MKIILRMNNVNYDITPIVDIHSLKKEIEIELTTEGEFYSASLVLPIVTQYELGPAIDFSRAIIRNSLVTIEKDGIELQWRLMGDVVTELPSGSFSHDISLIDRRSETTGINLPGLTLTQSKADIGSFYRTVHKLTLEDEITVNLFDNFHNDFYYNPTNVNLDYLPDYWPVLNTTTGAITPVLDSQSSDTSILDAFDLEEVGRTYNINVSMELLNAQVNYAESENYGTIKAEFSQAQQSVKVRIKLDSTVLSERTLTLPPATKISDHGVYSLWVPKVIQPSVTKYAKALSITLATPGTISIEIEKINVTNSSGAQTSFTSYKSYSKLFGRTPNEITETFDSTFSISNFNASIYSQASFDPNKLYLDTYIDKILNTIFIDEDPLYTLSAASRNILSQIESPEFTLQRYNLYQAIQEISDFLGASWEINSDDEIDFLFFDDVTVMDIDETEKQIRTGVSDLNDYASSFQLNTENIASDSFKTEGWLSVRAEGENITQITTDNVMIKTDDPINYIKSVKISGISLNLDGSTVTQEWDITNRVLDKAYWDTLPSAYDDSDTGRGNLLKNNTWFYMRGNPGLYGLTYLGGVEPVFIGSGTGNRSLFETIAAQAYEVTALSTTTVDAGLITQNSLRVKIEYWPFTASNAHIYKDDQSGFQIERNKYFNETARVNDPQLLGKVAQNNVNRLGGTEYTTTGYITSLSSLPRLGTINSKGQRLTKIILQLTEDYNRYTATYIADYTKISKFVGKKSDYRAEEIPNRNIVESSRIKRLRILFGSTLSLSEQGTVFLDSLVSNIKVPVPKIAKLEFTHSTGTETVYNTLTHNIFGKTAVWKVKAYSNFSFGFKKISTTLGGVTVYFQDEVRYTDSFGRVESFDITLYNDYNTMGTLSDSYPSTAGNLALSFNTESYDYVKDAREIFAFEKEISFSSTNINKYVVYDGITKYNSVLNGKSDYDIKCAVLDYIPNRSDLKLDLTRIKNTVTSVSKTNTEISVVSTATGVGIVFYEDKTRDILLVVNDDIEIGTYVIPYGGFTNLDQYTVTFNTNGGSSVINQEVLDGSTVTEPTTTKRGYDFDGWYTNEELTTEFDFDTPITYSITLYAKWVDAVDKYWDRVYTTTYTDNFFPSIESIVCPIEYYHILPDANNYNLNDIVRVIAIRECDEGNELCYIDALGNSFRVCDTQYYKVVENT